ncbi:MAG: hypothetical protein KGZ41_08255 [Dethiobacter sp.]|nr:hypothetical protein [Dethiobacter sp.]MBS3898799.1 hypothetical protein [Dethiobacter sp.]MBS3983775.1 hypothetical protein [Dethiobacter sp.]MCL4463703.1 hypothetical protein [Bacillota bacterium]MCL5993557.1 hypothetical protein [Bacillota bacterium]
MSEAIYVKDQETVIAISYPEMLKYHGRAYLAGVAMAFKLLELALSILAGEEIIPRDKISILLAVNGPGIIDGIEMVTRANTHGRLTVDQMISFEQEAPDAADGGGGKYYFEVAASEKKVSLKLKHGLIPAEFIELSYKVHAGTITMAETIMLQKLKEEIAAFLMASAAGDLFTIVDISPEKNFQASR